MGNTAHFQCPYHGWVYSNTGELVGVPAMTEAYPGGFDKSQWGGLRHIPPHVDSYAGFIFGSVDPKAPSLTDYLGDTTFYLDLIAKKTAGGLEVIGGTASMGDVSELEDSRRQFLSATPTTPSLLTARWSS